MRIFKLYCHRALDLTVSKCSFRSHLLVYKKIGFGTGKVHIIDMNKIAIIISDPSGIVELSYRLLSSFVGKVKQDMFFIKIRKHGLRKLSPVFRRRKTDCLVK